MKLKKPLTGNIALCPTGKLALDDISNANTEDSLLAKTSSETSSVELRKKPNIGRTFGLLAGMALVSIGITFLVYHPFDLLLDFRLEMTPHFPPYNWWKHPPDEVVFRVHIFNITNAEEFLTGAADKLRVEDVGPITFMEKLEHSNVTFNENGTITYVAKRTPLYLPDLNTIDLNASVTVPNLAVLGIASYLHSAPFFTKIGYNLLARRLDAQPLMTRTIYEYLFNNKDPFLDLASKLAPSLVPTDNLGILHEIYEHFEDTVTVYYGKKQGDSKFFLIDQYDGSDRLPGFSPKCSLRLTNSTEGVTYPQRLNKQSVLKYWRKTICRVVDLHFESEVSRMGMNAYKYSVPNDSYEQTFPAFEDCHRGSPPLHSGLRDASPCYYNLPVASSAPHYLYADDFLQSRVDGLNPNILDHESFVIVEPLTGIPMHSKARSQSNLIVHDLSGFTSKIKRFSDMIIPLFYIEYSQVGLPWYIRSLLYFTVNLLPIFQHVFSALAILLGTLLVAIFFRKRSRSRKLRLIENKKLHFEAESFLKV